MKLIEALLPTLIGSVAAYFHKRRWGWLLNIVGAAMIEAEKEFGTGSERRVAVVDWVWNHTRKLRWLKRFTRSDISVAIETVITLRDSIQKTE